MKGSYDKRLNVLIHRLQESDSPWGKRDKSLNLFLNFMKDGLKIEDPTSIAVVDAHRLPQKPIYRKGKRVRRPLIVKLTSVQDKNKIFGHAKNLKVFNQTRSDSNLIHEESVYISDHLPREFVLQRKRLYPQYKDALSKGRKPFWRIEDGSYNLYVNNIKV